MEPMKDSAIVSTKVHETKDRLREAFEMALHQLGLHDVVEIASVTLRVKRVPVQCPAGQVPVWETTTRRDGTIVSEWVCRQEP
jgi:hypothetical protein